MAEAIVSVVLEVLSSIIQTEIQQEVRLVVGVDEELRRLRSNLQAIQAVLLDAEQKGTKERAVQQWLDRLKATCYDMEDVLDEWNTAILISQIEGIKNALVSKQKVCFFFPSLCFGFKQVGSRREFALKIKDLTSRLDDIASEKDMFNFRQVRSTEIWRVQTTSIVDFSEIVGRDDEKNKIVRMLCESSEEMRALDIISIVGMGGIGKTALAQLAYNDKVVMSNFDTRIWVCVSDPFDEIMIAKQILESLQGLGSNLVALETLLQKIGQSIVGKKFLLVLDDVWTENYMEWERLYSCLKNGLYGSKILITSRKETVAQMMRSSNIIFIGALPYAKCWDLFSMVAFFGRSLEEREKLQEIGEKVVDKCRGLPLMAKTIGSLLRFKKTREEWQSILDSEMWEMQLFEERILPGLLLSYNDLPPGVKRCFSYCAMFPKGYDIEKNQLIKLWMAQGYLGLEEIEEMETIGQGYFDILATRSFFQDFKRDCDNNILFCKMHDLVHDFAHFLNKNECLTVEVSGPEDPFINSSCYEIRHLMLVFEARAPFLVSICDLKSLHSLIIQYGVTNSRLISGILPRLFDQLTFLRALNLSGKYCYDNLIIEIPREIEKLVHLRYLNLSSLKIKELPETLCVLYNLQTLELSWCTELKNLPQHMEKLINLRHLVNEGTSLNYMPQGIEGLTCLRTLSEFVVSGGGDDGKACTLESLKNLHHLQGSVSLKMLGNVTNIYEAKKAELKNKKNLFSLYLNFEKSVEEEMVSEDEEGRRIDKDVLEALLTPPNLERLEIRYYRGKTMPPIWMMLTKLKMLSLHDCINFEHLPPLGKLVCLESLSIWSIKSVKRVGNEFLGIEESSTSSAVIAFPKLVSLKFVNMEEWEEWDCGTIMPHLCSLSLVYCPRLKALPNHILQREPLKELNINWCPILKDHYTRLTGEEWRKISHVRDVMIDFQSVQRDALNLQTAVL